MSPHYSIFKFIEGEYHEIGDFDTEEEMLSQLATLREDGETYRAEYFNGVTARILEV